MKLLYFHRLLTRVLILKLTRCLEICEKYAGRFRYIQVKLRRSSVTTTITILKIPSEGLESPNQREQGEIAFPTEAILPGNISRLRPRILGA